jgi:hypothetical protein
MPKSGSPVVEYEGAINLSSSSQRNQERWSNLRKSRSSSSSSSGLCARQRFALDRFFYFTDLMVVVGRPGYRTDFRTIKGGLSSE